MKQAYPIAFSRLLKNYLRGWGFTLAGYLLFLSSLPLYRSSTSTDVLQRWSYAYVSAMALAALLGVGMLLWSIRQGARGRWPPPSSRFLGLGLSFWGLAYLISALDASTSAGRVFELNLIGSDHPVAALLEACSLWLVFVSAAGFLASRLSSAWKNAGLTFGTMTALVLLGETGLRIKAVAWPATQGIPTYSSALWARRFVEFNTLGMRDIEHRTVKPAGTLRLLTVGDSYAFGVGVEQSERFGELAVAQLRNATGQTWVSVNGGVPDTHTLDHLQTLRKLLPLQPDIVVLLYVFNDIEYLDPRSRPTARRGRLSRVLFENFYLYQELFARLRMIRFLVAGDDRPNPYFDSDLLDSHMQDLKEFIGIVRETGQAPVLIIPFDNLIGQGGRRTEQYERFLSSAEAHGLPVCSLQRAFDGYTVNVLRVNSLDAHPSRTANDLASAAALDCILTIVSEEWARP